jgi:hypothetical protein
MDNYDIVISNVVKLEISLKLSLRLSQVLTLL